jgi:hypothetical protein
LFSPLLTVCIKRLKNLSKAQLTILVTGSQPTGAARWKIELGERKGTGHGVVPSSCMFFIYFIVQWNWLWVVGYGCTWVVEQGADQCISEQRQHMLMGGMCISQTASKPCYNVCGPHRKASLPLPMTMNLFMMAFLAPNHFNSVQP